MLNSDRIDLVGHDPSTDEFVLIIAAGDEPIDTPAELQRLREKLNTYASYVLLGSLGSSFPQSIGKRVRVQFDCTAPPATGAAHVLAAGQRALAQHGIDLKVNILTPPKQSD
jgi:hypothetical protein